ncbi:hypothetical protein ACWOAH_03595 [Vagococcus vulneris]|uniref:Uncharacterized protein n=1 Tax=Vagococcus vulneris TaxID=1977869 RepID=A0A429ZWY1_9ENTE|nr:hypothetical protein [Vagococcus vulneris]RST98147.1 hypothetical protein CBF37_08935 [Vagococcus vulneris]
MITNHYYATQLSDLKEDKKIQELLDAFQQDPKPILNLTVIEENILLSVSYLVRYTEAAKVKTELS